MLFDVAALLITSAALGPAAEASGVSENSAIFAVPGTGYPALQSPAGSVDAAQFGALIDPAATSITNSVSVPILVPSTSRLSALEGVPLLRELSLLPSPRIASYLSSHSKVVTALLASPPAAREVRSWWGTLTPGQRQNLTTATPRLVGSLDGLPAAVRNTANRAWIRDSIHALSAKLPSISGLAQAGDARSQLAMLKSVHSALGNSKSKPQRSLLSVDISGKGKAAIVIGNLDKADYVTYMVPGMFFNVSGQLDDWTDDATRLYDEQVSWLNLLDKNKPGQAKKSVAVVAWLGYQTPDLTNIGSLDLAYQGRDNLARAIEGLQAERAGHEPFTTIVAHSYGSTAALMALTEYDFTVDAVAVVGCPGSAAQSVKDLHVRNKNVWVGAAAFDPVPNSAWFGSDPAASSYGAKTMAVGGGVDEITKAILQPSFGHNEYFDAGSESIRNLALIGINHGELVTTGAPSDKEKTLALEK